MINVLDLESKIVAKQLGCCFHCAPKYEDKECTKKYGNMLTRLMCTKAYAEAVLAEGDCNKIVLLKMLYTFGGMYVTGNTTQEPRNT